MRKDVEIDLDACPRGRKIIVVGGELPYVWIGDGSCFGCVPDKELSRLHKAIGAAIIDAKFAEELELACKAHKKKQEMLVNFIREVAEGGGVAGVKARTKLKQWNL